MISKTGVPAKTSRLPLANSRVFYGWYIVGVGFVTQIIQGIVSQGFASYLDVLGLEFHWSRAALAGPRSVTTIENAALGPVTGWLVDRFGPRNVVAVGVVMVGGGMVLFGLTNSMFMYYLSNIVMALGTGLEGLLVMSVAINNWFRRKRTIAQSVMLIGYALVGVIGVPALVYAQRVVGWRPAAIWTGIGVMAVGLPCTYLLRQRPEAHGLIPDGDRPGQSAAAVTGKKPLAEPEFDFSVRQALRTRTFWLLSFGLALSSLGMGAVQVHLFLHLEGSGLTKTAAALVWSVASIANIPARIIGGFLGDRLTKNVVMGISTLFVAGSIGVLAFADSFQMALLYAIPYGIGWGVRTPVMNSIQADYFGRRSQGTIRGWLQLVSLPFSIAAPIVAGSMADVQGSYQWAFTGMAIATLIGAILVFLATRPRLPVAQRVQ
jgi:MFS family permease